MRLDVFRAKTAAEANMRASGQWDGLNSEERRLVEKMVLDGKRAGLALPESEREEVTKLKKELSRTCLDFNVRTCLRFLSAVLSLIQQAPEKLQRRKCERHAFHALFKSLNKIDQGILTFTPEELKGTWTIRILKDNVAHCFQGYPTMCSLGISKPRKAHRRYTM